MKHIVLPTPTTAIVVLITIIITMQMVILIIVLTVSVKWNQLQGSMVDSVVALDFAAQYSGDEIAEN